ncbi:MAG TPA: YraN family protein [Candidatus Peribacteria bacterium]|nr:YraN family protein [Candidatus Peribacteria bacterium]
MVGSILPPSAPAHLYLGQHGEDIATAYLLEHGYDVRERNVRLGRDEIDLVAYDPQEGMVVFAEVKTRSRHSEAYPIRTAVNGRKRRALRRAIDLWITRENYDGPARIDVLSVCNGRVVEHLRDIGSDYLVDAQ